MVTRAGLVEADWVALGLYADNDAARRVYTRPATPSCRSSRAGTEPLPRL
ncbi:hypothetical protein NKG05_27620 [Oerskovia sp. M15]